MEIYIHEHQARLKPRGVHHRSLLGGDDAAHRVAYLLEDFRKQQADHSVVFDHQDAQSLRHNLPPTA